MPRLWWRVKAELKQWRLGLAVIVAVIVIVYALGWLGVPYP